jgi:hypothetical protein
VKLTGEYETYSIEFDATKWLYDPETIGDEEFSFLYADGDVFAMIVPERLPMSSKLLRDIIVDNLRSTADDFRILREETRQHKGASVLCLTMSGTVEGTPLIYHGYYYTGEAGTIQVVTFTGRDLFEQYKTDISAFLDGFTVLGKPSADPQPQDSLLGHWVTTDNLVHYYFGPNKMTVVYPAQPGRELAYSVTDSSADSVTLNMIGGNAPHSRQFTFHGAGRVTQTMKIGSMESKYELRFVDKKETP